MMLPFRVHFYRVSHQQSNLNKFKDFKTFRYHGIRIETFELTTVGYRRIKKTRLQNQNSNYMMKSSSRGPKNLFDSDDFLNYMSSNYVSSTIIIMKKRQEMKNGSHRYDIHMN